MTDNDGNIKITPLRPSEFGLYEHKVRRFNATIPHEQKDNLEDPALWVNCANNIDMGNDIRCIADDMSFIAQGVCTFKQGSVVKIKIISFEELDAVDYDDLSDEASEYEAKFRGPKKWCVSNKETGEIVAESIATKAEALKELDDYTKALRR